ncbi:cell wall glycosyl hydrolase Dfg5 [Pochonia chlamydosporia 170]|uniref:mannan endo-1,6-alpha-mannosidase n=1 Tax=Pochonia chlamydosporia 170 TaxID=1380566 RepID=A0A179FGH4_METCM|nr:cell wall glycosyl hydrolase Dfg5 [Pochonia chlamydosporia 170]OAQ64636.1 cell wall glycosyl hydrolase Dfg5 [Pochonia chlamydosporia 170]
MFGTLVDYWHLTGDNSYNAATLQALVHQASPKEDFLPTNQSRNEGNDDQGFWAMAAMSAAENKFVDPPSDQPQWLALVQSVFNQYVSRWEPENCGGGMRWQIYSFNKGWYYKNSISNGCFFNVAARLHRYTGNSTYGEWATKIFEWQQASSLITKDYGVHDGVSFNEGDQKCPRMDIIEWTYNAGIFLHGAAAMYNATEDAKWKTAIDGILKHVQTKFVKDGLIFEQQCEGPQNCNNDQQSFKGYLIRWLAATSKLAPYTYDTIKPLLQKAATAAASVCIGTAAPPKFNGLPGTACGFGWTTPGKFDGIVAVGSHMNALDAVMYNLVQKAAPPVTQKSGGTSKGNPAAGSGGTKDPTALEPLTGADKAGAGILTVLCLAGIIGGTAFMLLDIR